MATVALVSRPASVLPKISSSCSPAVLSAASVSIVQQRKLHNALIPKGKGGRSCFQWDSGHGVRRHGFPGSICCQ
ncbi:NADH dehydrogenase [ubiquinone] [Lates japonicus]|uniref:NADH dehydrogenase [ubiquinone] n=1 Tax=Lates japonicus TaxID=270547 RepID=A0AAD3RF99_LATJO|nr:NADH dehydrogenase [ubiquinone] [Lates japonicus]